MVLVGWGLVLTAVCGILMGAHLLTLPRPDGADPVLVAELEALRPAGADIHAVHVMYTECGCSRRILDHLASRAPLEGTAETVLLVGEDAEFEAAVRASGFTVIPVAQEALRERFHIEAAPLLVISDAQAQVRYLGGYTTRKRGYDIRDVALIAGVRDGASPSEELPLYGCATNRELQQTLDPIGVRFPQTWSE